MKKHHVAICVLVAGLFGAMSVHGLIPIAITATIASTIALVAFSDWLPRSAAYVVFGVFGLAGVLLFTPYPWAQEFAHMLVMAFISIGFTNLLATMVGWRPDGKSTTDQSSDPDKK